MNIQVEPLTEVNKYEARDLAVKASVGKPAQVLRYYNKSLHKGDNNLFVAKKNDRVVGIIGWYIDDGHWAGKSLGTIFPSGDNIYWVSFFAVSDELRGRGVGTLLMKKLFNELFKKRACELWTYTARARIFYEKMGFTMVTRAVIENEEHDFLKYVFV